jgi:hypothetical protein
MWISLMELNKELELLKCQTKLLSNIYRYIYILRGRKFSPTNISVTTAVATIPPPPPTTVTIPTTTITTTNPTNTAAATTGEL